MCVVCVTDSVRSLVRKSTTTPMEQGIKPNSGTATQDSGVATMQNEIKGDESHDSHVITTSEKTNSQ